MITVKDVQDFVDYHEALIARVTEPGKPTIALTCDLNSMYKVKRGDSVHYLGKSMHEAVTAYNDILSGPLWDYLKTSATLPRD